MFHNYAGLEGWKFQRICCCFSCGLKWVPSKYHLLFLLILIMFIIYHLKISDKKRHLRIELLVDGWDWRTGYVDNIHVIIEAG